MTEPSTPTRVTGSGKVSHSTPIVPKVSSVFSERIRSQVDPLVTRELEGKILPARHSAFLEHALDAPPTLVAKWRPLLHSLGSRKKVQNFLTELANAGNDEKRRYEPFSNMANFIMDETRGMFPLPPSAIPDLRFVRSDPAVIKGLLDTHTPARKPDVILVRKEVADRRAKGGRANIYWTNIFSAIEFKVDPPKQPPKKASVHTRSSQGPSPAPTPPDASSSGYNLKRKMGPSISGMEPPTRKSRSGSHNGSLHTGQSGVTHDDFNQLSSYPLEMLSSTNGTRSHALSMFVDADELQLWYYDRAGAIHSDTRVNFRDDFVSFAAIIMALVRLNLAKFGVLSVVEFPSQDDLPTSLEGAKIRLRDQDGQEHTVTLTSDIISSRPGIVGRSSFVCGATCNTIAGDLVVKFSFQDVTRTNEYEIIQHAKACGVEYLPLAHFSQDFHRLSGGSRGQMLPILSDGILQYQDRVIRVMVSQRYTPVYKLPSLPIFQAVIRNICECIKQLREKAQVLHRDISYTNIMAEKTPEGSFRGVLNDFDLAVRLDALAEEGHSSLHQTGTLPFMAVELLTDQPANHRFRHDLESLFYVVVWIAAHYDQKGEDVHRDALSSWQTGELRAIRASKRQFVDEPSVLNALRMASCYEPLKTLWLQPLRFIVLSIHMQWVQSQQGQGSSLLSQIFTDEQLYKAMSSILAVEITS